MVEKYLGHLSRQDRLYEYLQHEIFPELGGDCRDGIRVFGTNGSNAVYIYEERRFNLKAVGKFFYPGPGRNWDDAVRRLDREWNNLHRVREVLDGCHYVARPLGRNTELNCLLVTEYCSGLPLETVIGQAISEHKEQLLHKKLCALAWFLAKMHNRSARPRPVDFNIECRYFEHLASDLAGLISDGELHKLNLLKEKWAALPEMYQDCEVLVHGDATPANFFFGDDMYVISFDLERMRYADRIFDLGRLAGELQHFYLRATGNKYLAEEFISTLLGEYSGHFPDRERTFDSIVKRVPFYMGMTLLRIARNSYLSLEYRHRLISEAILCLRR